MWILSREIRWEMGHALVNYQGPCQRLHGHSWKATVEVAFKELDQADMGIDFAELKAVEKWIDANWDHQTLLPYNHLALQPYVLGEEEWDPIIKEIGFVPVPFNPTSERLSTLLAMITANILKVPAFDVTVTLHETAKNACTYLTQKMSPEEVEQIINIAKGIRL